MTSNQPPGTHEGQLRQEAADWWAVMHGEEADDRRTEFDNWLNRGSYHRNAYNRISEIHALGKHLKDDPDFAGPLPRVAPRRPLARALIPVAIFASGLLAGSWAYREFSARTLLPPVLDASANRQSFAQVTQLLSTRIGEIRPINLQDGTVLILDTDSLARVSYRSDRRLIRLERGRARLQVANDPRPFALAVGGATVLASAAQFDVERSAQGKSTIHVISGAARIIPDGNAHAQVQVQPGQSLAMVFGADQSLHPIAETASSWPTGSIDVDTMALSDLVAQANRYSGNPIILADPKTASLRVSGHFRINDTPLLAERLVELFSLSLEHGPGGRITLRPK